jgi:hypothetical protein
MTTIVFGLLFAILAIGILATVAQAGKPRDRVLTVIIGGFEIWAAWFLWVH